MHRLPVSKLITKDVTFDIRGGGGEGLWFLSAMDDNFHVTCLQQRLRKARKFFLRINYFVCTYDVKL